MTETGERHIESREVLADAYRVTAPARMLTHAVVVNRSGEVMAVMCRRVNVDNLADRFAAPPDAPITCKACATALRRHRWTYKPQSNTAPLPQAGDP